MSSRCHRLPRICPSPVIAGFALAGFAGEIALLRSSPENVFGYSGTVTALSIGVLVLFWWAAACSFCAIAEGVRVMGDRAPRPVVWGVWGTLTIALTLALIAYAASWGLYFRSGRFSNIEAVIFGVENARTGWFWEYLIESERKYLWLLGGVFLAGLVLVPLGIRLATRTQAGKSVRITPVILLWGGLTVILIMLKPILVFAHPTVNPERRDLFVDAVKNSVNPIVTLGSSAAESLFEEPIGAVLDTDQLKPIGANDYPLEAGRPLPSVIIVAIESLRADVVHLRHQGREVMPNLNALAKNGLQCTRAYTQSTHSDYADPCIASSLYPLRSRRHHFYRTTDPWPKTRIYDVLKRAGHATAIISSQNEAWGSMDRFLQSPNLDLFYDAERSEHEAQFSVVDVGLASAIQNKELSKGKLTDSHTTDTAIAWVTEQTGQGRPFCLCLNFQSSHFPYQIPPDREQPFQPCAIDFDASFLHYPPEKVEVVRNAYYNALYECDKHLGRVVTTLKSLGRLDNTILVVLGENGEAFWENGLITHAGAPIEPTVRVACVLHAPQLLEPRVEDYPVELIDVVPTLFGLMGLPPHPNFQGTDFLAKDRIPAEERLLFMHVETGLSRYEGILLGGRWKLMVDRQRGGGVRLFDLATDPGETTDLTQSRPELTNQLRELVATWRRNQLAYYHFPRYYENYYPPRPPRWKGPTPR